MIVWGIYSGAGHNPAQALGGAAATMNRYIGGDGHKEFSVFVTAGNCAAVTLLTYEFCDIVGLA